MSSVLYDVPGPRAVLRNRILGVITVLVILGAIGFVAWRMAETGQFSAEKWYVFTFTSVWEQILGATGRTLAAFAAAAVFSLVLGFALAIGRMSDHAWVRAPFVAIVEIFRAIPVLIFMALLFYGLPVLGIRVDSYWAVVIALTAYNGSVLAEVLRAGVEAVPRGQREAGYAVGLRKSGVMRLILLPQAVRAMLPVIVAQLVVTLKDTALGSIITYNELLYFSRLIGQQAQYDRPILQAGLVAAVIYITLCLILSGVAKWLEIRMRKSPRVSGARPAVAPLAHEATDTELLAAQRPGTSQAREQRRDDRGA
ncbi:amino acid ABC transporter permease [Microbacterium sp. NPDC091313]